MRRATVTVDASLRFTRREAPDLADRLAGLLSRERVVRGKRGAVSGTTTFSLYRETNGAVEVPRGALDLLRTEAHDFGIDLDFRSRVVADLRAQRPSRLGVELRPYQERAVDEMLRVVQGLVHLPCGGGKTTIGAAAVVRLGLPALVIVPTKDILDQWIETLDRMGAARAFRATGKRVPGPGEVAVATPASLRPGSKASALLTKVAVVVVDECHRAVAPTWLELLARCPARYRFGLTATIDRSDRMEWAIPFVFGRVIEPATIEDLIAGGWLVRPSVFMVDSGWTPSDDLRWKRAECPSCGAQTAARPSALLSGVRCRARVHEPHADRMRKCGVEITGEHATGETLSVDWSELVAELVASEIRNATILRLVTAAVKGGRRSLALVPTVALTRQLADALRDRGIEAHSLTGEEPKGRRRAVLAGLRSGAVQAVIATRVADEGLDVPDLDCVIAAEPGRARGRALQRAGRSMRPGGLPPIVIDLVDRAPELRAQAMVRVRSYRENYGPEAIMSASPASLDLVLSALGGSG